MRRTRKVSSCGGGIAIEPQHTKKKKKKKKKRRRRMVMMMMQFLQAYQ